MHDDSPRTLRRAAVGALAAELGHDLQGPLNLFLSAVERASRGDPLDQEDLALLREELAGLKDLGGRLRRLALRSLHARPSQPSELVERALGYLPALSRTSLALELTSWDDVRLTCDDELMSLALAELMDNALHARTARAGVRFTRGEAASGFCVWDDGQGFPQGPVDSLRWGESSREGALGLGLSVALRAARAHGFELKIQRRDALTEVWLSIPARFTGWHG